MRTDPRLKAAPGLLLAVLLLCAALVGGCERKLAVGDSEKAMLLRAADLSDFGYGLKNTEAYETFEKTRVFDGSYEIVYQFETPESEKEYPLFLYVTVTVENRRSDAMVSLEATRLGAMIGLRSAGVKEREIEGFFRYGDVSRYYVLEIDGKPVGSLFSVRERDQTYTILMTGMYFDNAEEWRSLVEPKLRKFSAYRPT